ncbi:MAG: hypothetical protein ACTSO7_08255 [Candidatus Heimdallarchaeota archaeon]
MSYVEKSFYRYLKKVLISGIKALFTKKFLIYTIFFLVIIATTTITALVGIPSISLTIFNIPPEKMINYVLYFELAFAIAYIFVGFFLAKIPVWAHILLVILLTGGITTGFVFLDNFVIIAIITMIMFCLWMFVTTISAYSFSKNLLGSRLTGSILFMGKKVGGSALFSGILTPIIVLCIGMNGYVLYMGIISLSWLYMITSITGILMGGFILIAIWVLAKKDDVFYTILSFFYLIINTHTIQVVFRLALGDTNYISWLNIIVSVFFLLNTISKYYRKVEKLDADFLPKEAVEVAEEEKKFRLFKRNKQQDKEEFFISDVFQFVSNRGVIMIILGFALTYHSMMLQIGFNRVNISAIFETISGGIVQTAHSVTMLFAAGVVIISIILYYSWKRFKNYTSPQIFRLNFLPPYDEIENFVVNARAGNIDWKLLARDATVSIAKKGLRSTAKLSVTIKDQSKELARKRIEKTKEKTRQLKQKILDLRKDEDDYDNDDF